MMLTQQRRSEINLWLSVCIVSLGSLFQVYNVVIFNSLCVPFIQWLNGTNGTISRRYHVTFDFYIEDSPNNFEQNRVFYLVISAVQAALFLGAIVGSLAIHWSADKFGYRNCLRLNNIVNVIGVLLSAFCIQADSLELFLVGRLLTGFAMSLGLGLSVLYVLEMPSPRLRLTVAASQPIFLGLGCFVGTLCSTEQLWGSIQYWPYAMGLPMVPSCLQLLYLSIYCRHDGPRYLYVCRSNERAAVESLLFFQGPQNLICSADQLRNEYVWFAFRKHEVSLWTLVSRPKYRVRLALGTVLVFCVMLTGTSALLSYSTELFVNDIPLTPREASWATFGAVGVTWLLAPIGILLIIDRIVGRLLIALMCGGCLLGLVGLPVFVQFQQTWSSMLAIASLAVHQFSFSSSICVLFIVPMKLLNDDMRSLLASVLGSIFWTLGFIVASAYLPFRTAVGLPLSLVPFIVCTLMCGVILLRKLPENQIEVQKTALPAAEGPTSAATVTAIQTPSLTSFPSISAPSISAPSTSFASTTAASPIASTSVVSSVVAS